MTTRSKPRAARSVAARTKRASSSGLSATTSAWGGRMRGGIRSRSRRHVREDDRGVQQRVEQPLELRAAGARPHPAQLAAVLDQADAVLAREIGRGERGGAARRDVDDRRAVRPHVRQRVEQEHDVGVPLPVMLGDVQRAEPQGGAPVHVADVIARREGPDVARLDAFALRGRHVVAHERLGAQRARQVPERRQAAGRRPPSAAPGAGASAAARPSGPQKPQMRAAEAQALAARAAQRELPADLLARPQREERVVAAALEARRAAAAAPAAPPAAAARLRGA